MLNYKDRVPCKECGTEHCVTNRVNWWDSCGNAYGPETKKDWYIPLCDKCAARHFERYEEIMSRVQYEDLSPVFDDLSSQFCDVYNKAEQIAGRLTVGATDVLNKYAITCAVYNGKVIGFIVYKGRRIPGTTAVMLQISDIYVLQDYRYAGIGRQLVGDMLNRYDDYAIAGIEFEHNMHDSVVNLLLEGMDLGSPVKIDDSVKAICVNYELWTACYKGVHKYGSVQKD